MSASGTYLILNEKNLLKLNEAFNIGVDDILHFAKNRDINLYIRIEKGLSKSGNIRTEFDSEFELTAFINSEKYSRKYDLFLSFADYNVDFLPKNNSDNPFGISYGIGKHLKDFGKVDKDKLKLLQFDGFLEIPSCFINESKQEIVLNDASSFYFLENEFGKRNTDFVLNFSFPNGQLQIPIWSTYILFGQLHNIVEENFIKGMPKSEKDTDIAELQAKTEALQAENAKLKAQLQDNAQRKSAVDSEPVLGNAKAYDVRERETHLLIIGALSNLLAENKQKYQKGNGGINQSAISKDIETEIIELLQPATKTRTIDTIRPRIRESLNLITKAE